MEYVKPNKNTQVYVLGIDFGHGETSADLCGIQWDDKFSQLKQPESIEIFSGRHTIKSVLLIEKEGDNESHYIGQQAINRYANPKNHNNNTHLSYYEGFKKIPSRMTDQERNIMRIYMKEVYQQIRYQRPELTDTNHVVYIACPSNPKEWKDEELRAYAEIALEAGIPLAKIDENNIGIIRESRAAFIKARSNPESKASVKEGILLIDFGSSTVDLTYYSSKFTEKPVDDGYACGASNVEYRVAEDFASKNINVAQAINNILTAETAIHLTIRDCKENFYSGDSEEMEVTLNLIKITNGLITGNPFYFYSEKEIKQLLSDYVEDIKQSFINYRDKYLQDKPIELIFLTGGASRMNLIEDVAKEVFGSDKSFYREMNPSLTISNGIALAGRADLRTFAMEEELLSAYVIKNADIATDTIDSTAESIAKRVINDTSLCYSSFASKSDDDNLASLESDIKKKVDSIYASKYLSSAYNDVLKSVANNKIIPSINNIVKDYFPDFEIEDINSSSSFSLSVKSDSINTISSVISSSLSKIEEGLIEGLAKLLFNIATGSIAIAEGALANVAIGFINLFKDKKIDYVDIDDFVNEVTISFRDKSTKLSSSQRTDVKNEFNKNSSSYKDSMCLDVKNKLKDDSSLINQINTKGREEIRQYIVNQIQKARIMLN